MFSTTLRLAAIVCSVLVGLGWLLFAIDESKAASKQTVDAIAGQRAASYADVTPDQERAREKAHSRAREAIDDANDILLKPFAPVTANSGDTWVRRSVPALIALLVYGFGLGYLARFMSGRA